MDARKKMIFLLIFLFFILFVSAKNYDPMFSKDKLAHFTTSFSLTMWSYSYFKFQKGFSYKNSSRNAFFIGITIGLGKESYDGISGLIFKKRGKFFSLKDLFYDILGTSLAMGIIYSLDKR